MEGYLTKIPSWEKFYQEFRNMRVDTLETFISQLGTKITNKTIFDIAIDSSGIGVYGDFLNELKLRKLPNYLERFILRYHYPIEQ